jgi:ParB family chromosome partitioning protein
VPAVVRDVAEKRAFEMALVENLQREDLNPIEEAQGFERLIEEFGYTQEALAGRVGKDRSTVANALRLLRLPTAVRALVTEGRLQMGHARALLGIESVEAIERLARRVVARDLSVRQVEALVKHEREGRNVDKAPSAPKAPSASARDLGERLSRALGTRVRVVENGPGTGHLEVAYHSLDQLDAVLAKILRP